MTVIERISDLSLVPGPAVLAVGVFDGLHLGHRAVLQRALDAAQKLHGTPVAVTFDPHPARTLRPGSSPRILTATPHKIRLLSGMGFCHTLVIRFDAAFASTEADDFLAALVTAANPLGAVVVGCGWTFGHGRRGTVELIRQTGAKHGFFAFEVPSVDAGGSLVSSTRVRAAVERGDLAEAALCLGRPYSVLGTVVEGRKLGRTIGFPTANLRAYSEQFPPDGVYAVRATWDNTSKTAVANIGIRPTLKSDGERTLEVHIPGFSGDLYGRDMEIVFLEFLRPEQKFSSVEELSRQIGEDVRKVIERMPAQ